MSCDNRPLAISDARRHSAADIGVHADTYRDVNAACTAWLKARGLYRAAGFRGRFKFGSQTRTAP
jgi:hypothetical protein